MRFNVFACNEEAVPFSKGLGRIKRVNTYKLLTIVPSEYIEYRKCLMNDS